MEAFRSYGDVLWFAYAVLPLIMAPILVIPGILGAKYGRKRWWGALLLVPLTLTMPLWISVLDFELMIITNQLNTDHHVGTIRIVYSFGLAIVEIGTLIAVPLLWKRWSVPRLD